MNMCRVLSVYIAAGALIPAIAAASKALAEDPLPQEFNVRYNIRALPSDPLSAITWTIDIDLRAEDADGNYVAWTVDSVTIHQLDAARQPIGTWSDAAPSVNLPAGLWWIGHADPEYPLLSEFVEPPQIEGTAAAANPADPDLNYSLEGGPYEPSPQPPLFSVTAALSYSLLTEGSTEPAAEGDDDPVEVPPEDDPPIGYTAPSETTAYALSIAETGTWVRGRPALRAAA